MLAISDDEQRSYRAKSWLPFGLRRDCPIDRARTLLQLLTDVQHRQRRCASSSLRRRSQRGPRDFRPGLLGFPEAAETVTSGAGILQVAPVMVLQSVHRRAAGN